MKKPTLRLILIISLIIFGTFLIGINIIGLFKSLRNNEINNIPKRTFSSHILLSYKDVLYIASQHYKSTEQLVYNINHAVYNGIIYYWDDERKGKETFQWL